MRIRMLRARQSIAIGLVSLTMIATAADLRADGWKAQLQSVKALGLSFAGRNVALDDASTVWFNPAGMNQLQQKWTITFAPPVIAYGADFSNRGSTSLLGQPMLGATSADAGRTVGIPHVYAVGKLNDRVSVGFGLNAPFGLGSDYGQTWVGRYHATKTELSVLNINPAVAVNVGHGVSLGFGLDIQHSDAELGNMIDFGSIGAAVGLPFVPQGHDGQIKLDASDWAVGYDLSVAWNVNPRARIGATFRSQIEHSLEGPADFTVPAEASVLTGGGALFVDTRATVVLPMPREFSVSASYEINPKWVVLGDLTWTDWSPFRRFEVTFANPAQPTIVQDALFDDSVRIAFGAIYRANERWELRGGGLYETSPVPDATRTPRLPESNDGGFSFGATYRLGKRADLDFAYDFVFPYDTSLNLRDPSAGLLAGDVRRTLSIFAAGVTIKY